MKEPLDSELFAESLQPTRFSKVSFLFLLTLLVLFSHLVHYHVILARIELAGTFFRSWTFRLVDWNH